MKKAISDYIFEIFIIILFVVFPAFYFEPENLVTPEFITHVKASVPTERVLKYFAYILAIPFGLALLKRFSLVLGWNISSHLLNSVIDRALGYACSIYGFAAGILFVGALMFYGIENNGIGTYFLVFGALTTFIVVAISYVNKWASERFK